MRFPKILSVGLLVLALVLTTILPGMAAATTKQLSTNFTLINLGGGAATGVISYFKPDGSQWKADEPFSIATAGGQAAFRQYFDNNLPAGQGSAVVSADQPLGAVVQIQARAPQIASNDAYIGVADGATTQYVPLVIRQRQTASGLTNSVLTVQNTGTSPVNVTIDIKGPTGATQFTKTINNLAGSASAVYDLSDESAANIPDAFLGSAVVNAPGGKVTVVASMFMGPNGMQTVNGFSTPGTDWVVPLFFSRLPNTLSSPLAIQNLSGADMAPDAITVTCKKNPASAGTPDTLTIKNVATVGNTARFDVNPVGNAALPDNWYGSCAIHATGPVVATAQLRRVGGDQTAVYQAIPAGSTDKTVLVPLAAKQLDNTFSTVNNIMNLNATTDAHVKFTYIPSPDYINGGGSNQNIVIDNVLIPAGGMIQQNLRISSGAGSIPDSTMPKKWTGSLVITSYDQPITGVVELTFLSGAGDTYMAHNVFTKP